MAGRRPPRSIAAAVACLAVALAAAAGAAPVPARAEAGSDQAPSPAVETVREVTAQSLCLCGLRAEVAVKVAEGGGADGLTVILRGTAEAVETVSVETVGGELRLSGGPRGSRVTTTITSSDGNTHTVVTTDGGASVQGSFSGGVSVVSRGSSGGDLSATVLVPHGTPLRAAPLLASAEIGALHGPLDLVVESGDVTAGAAGPVSINLRGAGDVRVAEARDRLTVVLTGSGSVVVEEGAVNRLSVTLTGAGDVRFGGRAETADLTLTGAGDITVDRVAQRPETTVTGAGSVTVLNW